MAASGELGAQAVQTGDIRIGFALQDQGLRGVESGAINSLAVNQPVQQVQQMSLGRDAAFSGASPTAVNMACSS